MFLDFDAVARPIREPAKDEVYFLTREVRALQELTEALRTHAMEVTKELEAIRKDMAHTDIHVSNNKRMIDIAIGGIKSIFAIMQGK